MPSTILGKRARASEIDANCEPLTKRLDRKYDEDENDENRAPLVDDSLELEDGGGISLVQGGCTVVVASSRNTRKICIDHVSPRKAANTATEIYDDGDVKSQVSTPHTSRYRDALSNKVPVTPRHRVVVGGRPSTPRTPRTPSTPSSALHSVFDDAKKVFARSANPTAIVGRDSERKELEHFIGERVTSGKGGCLYVSGPPGTGKSALVTEICAGFKEKTSVQYAYVNCMSVKRATDVYSIVANELDLSDDEVFENGSEEVLQSACLDAIGKKVLLVVLDEIDQLLTLDDTVLYSLFQWSFAKHSKLVLVGIANALDLTDRFLPRLKARNLKPTLLPFLPYTAAEIALVLTSRSRSLLPQNTTVSADFTPFLHPTAVQLISKKVAAQSGDLRKAFDIAQRAIELVERETRGKHTQHLANESQNLPPSPSRTPLGENQNLSSSPPSSMVLDSPTKTPTKRKTSNTSNTQLTPETAPRASLPHVVRVTSLAFNNAPLSRLKTLNLQQKAVLCSLVSLEQKTKKLATSSLPSPTPSSNRSARSIFATPTKQRMSSATTTQASTSTNNTAPTLRTLYETYTTLCKRDNILHALSSTEFRDVVANLETLSLVSAVDGKKGGGGSFAVTTPITTPGGRKGRGGFGGASVEERRIKACVGLKELEGVVEGVGGGVLKMILAGEGV